MKANGVTRVVGLLNSKEIATYAEPPVKALEQRGMKGMCARVYAGAVSRQLFYVIVSESITIDTLMSCACSNQLGS